MYAQGLYAATNRYKLKLLSFFVWIKVSSQGRNDYGLNIGTQQHSSAAV